MVLPVRSYPLRRQQPWIPPHISLMAFTFYFLCCSQNNFFGSHIFLHSAACLTTLIPTKGIWDYILSWMKVRASVFTIKMKSLLLQSSQGPGFKCWGKRRISYRAAYAIIRMCIHSAWRRQGRERCVASYLSQHPHLALVPPCSKIHTQA